jgi:uncharacterized DUF497 family protein
MRHPEGFEWHHEKAESNYRKHGVEFQQATRVFDDAFAVEGYDPLRLDYIEDRYLIIGMAGGQLLTVVYTERQRTIRLISARKSSRREHDDYYRQNASRRDRR